VIHLAAPERAYRNAEIAFAHGAAGVFVISMDGLDDAIDPVAFELKRRNPGRRVGVNYLTLPAHIALARSLSLGMDATWTDRPGVRSEFVDDLVPAAITPVLEANPAHLFFGSVAFKYQAIDRDPPKAARLAMHHGMIPTTSGEATGFAPPARKLHDIRQAIGAGPLALASGVTPGNAAELGRYLTHILVATGISKSEHELDEMLLRSLMARLARLER
jgi:hypothetical protein